MFVLQILSLIIEFIVIKYNFYDLHRIVTNLYYFFLCIFCSMASFFFCFPNHFISILKSILLDIVLQPTEHLLAILNNFFERVSLIDLIEQLG